MERIRKRISLKFSLAGAFLVAVVVSVLIIGTATLINLSSVVTQAIKDRLHDIVGLSSFLFNGDVHAELTDISKKNGEAHQKLLALSKKIRQLNPDIRYIYTLKQDANGDIRLIFDSEYSIEKEGSTEIAHFGEIYENPPPDIIKYFKTRSGITIDSNFYTDKWGTWLTGLTTLHKSDGTFECVIGVDIASSRVYEVQRNQTLLLFLLIIIILIPILILGLLVAQRISDPIINITKDMGRIQALDLSGVLEDRSIIKEVYFMTDAIQNMKNGLRSFRKYVPADLVNKLLLDHKEAVLGAEKRELSFFFSDIKDFTKISESLSPEELASHLGVYLEGMTSALEGQKATVDKFIGDAIMAFWNAPNLLPNHAELACRAALSCQKFISSVLESNSDFPRFHTRIGIHTGEAIVGNMGYESRLTYTAIGDTVNLASRLEGINKLYGTSIICSESTYTIVKDLFVFRYLDTVAVKGKSIGVPIYELIGEVGQVSEEKLTLLKQWQSAIAVYKARDWRAAESVFTEIRKQEPYLEPAISLYLHGIQHFAIHGIENDWSGIRKINEK